MRGVARGGVLCGYCVCSWLFESALARKIVPVEPHLLINSSPEASPSTAAALVKPHLPDGSPKDPLPSPLSASAEGCGNAEHEGLDESAILEGVVICFGKKLPSLSSEEASHMFHT